MAKSRIRSTAHWVSASRKLICLPRIVARVVLVVALGGAAMAQAQTAGGEPKATVPLTTPQQTAQLQDALDKITSQLSVATQAMTPASGSDGTAARAALQTIAQNLTEANQNLADAKHQAAALNLQAEKAALGTESENNALYIVLILTAAFVLISAVVILVLSSYVRKAFYEPAAKDPDGNWRTYLMQLPLGAPEGSIRALLSMYVVIFGLLVLVMQKRLNLPNVDAIAGFVGIVITFYFTSRTADQARKSVGAAVQAANNATDAANKATDAANTSTEQNSSAVADATKDIKDHTTAQVQSAIAAINSAQPQPAAAASGAPASDDKSRLRQIQNDLQMTRQVMGALKGLGVGTDLFTGADTLAGNADQLLGTIDKVLQGGADGPAIANVVGAGTQLLGQLGDVGLPGVFGGAVSVLGSVMKVASPALAGLAGGPVGVVAGLVTGGLTLLADEQKFNAWKAALLAKPFDRSLLPASVDGNTALLALELSPLMSKRLDGAAPNVATELLRACITPAADGNPRNSTDLAHELLTGADSLGLQGRFASETELSEALEEYRTSAIFMRARDELSGQIAIPAVAGSAATSIDMGTLLTGALQLSRDPRAASALEKIVYTVQALGALHLDPGRLTSLVQVGLEAGAAMVGTTRTAEDPRT